MRQCPSDGTVLRISRRSSVEIDTCPLCRGVWLDRGELDKIIARADQHPRPNVPPSMPPFRRRPTAPPTDSPENGGALQNPAQENWLADLFDTPTDDDRSLHPDSR